MGVRRGEVGGRGGAGRKRECVRAGETDRQTKRLGERERDRDRFRQRLRKEKKE